MRKIPVIILFVAVWMSIAGCNDFFESVVDLDVPEHESKLAVTALLGNGGDDDSRQLLISYSVGGLEESSEEQLVDDATVSLGGTPLVFTGNSGIYSLPADFEFVPGESYELIAEAPGFPIVTAVQTFPVTVPVMSATVNGEMLTLGFHDPPGTEDYYGVSVFLKYGEGEWSRVWVSSFESIKPGTYYYDGLLFSDQTFDGEYHEFDLKMEYYDENEEGQEVQYKFVLSHTNGEMIRYYQTLESNEMAQSNPFAQPVIVYSNIEGGYGIFSLSNDSELVIGE